MPWIRDSGILCFSVGRSNGVAKSQTACDPPANTAGSPALDALMGQGRRTTRERKMRSTMLFCRRNEDEGTCQPELLQAAASGARWLGSRSAPCGVTSTRTAAAAKSIPKIQIETLIRTTTGPWELLPWSSAILAISSGTAAPLVPP